MPGLARSVPDLEGELLMTDPSPLLGVTGATGRLGSRVARRLAAAGAAQRLLVRIRGPAADGRVAAVAQDDIADAAVLRDPERHTGITYSLTGPQALSLDDVAATLSARLGRPVRYQRETVEEALRLRRFIRRSALAGRRLGLDLPRYRERRSRRRH